MDTRSPLVRDLAAQLSPDALLTDERELPAYGRDFWEQRGIPGAVVRAASSEDVSATLHFAGSHGVPVVPRAAGTNVGGGFVPTRDSILLDLRGLDQVLSIDRGRREAVVQPGVLNGALQAQLGRLGLCWSPDPASAALSTVGGNIAENAGGPHCLKYGVTVHHVAGLQCVLPSGDVIRLEDTDAGPDLLGVVVGSEGTLAVVTEARLPLRPLPAVTRTLMGVFDRAEEAAEAVSAIIAAGIIPAALEFFDRTAVQLYDAYEPTIYPKDADAILLLDVDGDPDVVVRDMNRIETHLRRHARDVQRADDDTARAALWRGRLQTGQAAAALRQQYVICDVTVPRERIPAMYRAVQAIAQRLALIIPVVGHAGDGNMHPLVMYDTGDPRQVAACQEATESIATTALNLGGTLTGEHGIGSEKREQMRLRFSSTEVAAMRAVKRAFDPVGILNPGILLPDPSPDEPALPHFDLAISRALDARRAGRSRQGNDGVAIPVTGSKSGSAPSTVEIDPENLTVTVGAGLPLRTLATRLAERQLDCALLEGMEPARTVGATVSGRENRQGVRQALLGVRAVLPESLPVRFGSQAVKDVAGYDLKRLYIGSGGAFGSLEHVTLRVTPSTIK